jgi:ABC-type molybdate transport system substrate-binding protein
MSQISIVEGGAMKRVISWITVFAVALCISSAAHTQTKAPITLLAPNPLKNEIDEIVKSFEQKTGYTVQVTYGSGVGTRQTVAQGGALDV